MEKVPELKRERELQSLHTEDRGGYTTKGLEEYSWHEKEVEGTEAAFNLQKVVH